MGYNSVSSRLSSQKYMGITFFSFPTRYQHENQTFVFSGTEVFAATIAVCGFFAVGNVFRYGTVTRARVPGGFVYGRFARDLYELSRHDRRIRFVATQFARTQSDLQRLSCSAHIDAARIFFQSAGWPATRGCFCPAYGAAVD
jgi:hypothetical protein